MPLPTAVESWVELANQKNGHDNVAVVLMSCTITGDTVIVDEKTLRPPLPTQQNVGYPTELTEASKALLYGENEALTEIDTPTEEKPRRSLQALVLSILLLFTLSFVGVAGVLLWQNLQPTIPDSIQEPTTAPD